MKNQIVVVGGGPAGLATAIVAALQGNLVTVLEKRLEYTRAQSIMLIDNSLVQLEKWNVDLPELHTAVVGPNERMGFVEIHHLEIQLAARAKALGVKVVQATFIELDGEEVIAKMDEKEVRFSYDILVGADGAHSNVRKALGIAIRRDGKAIGISALIPIDDASREIEATLPMQTKWGFARRITTPVVSIVFLQSKNRLSQQEMVLAVTECGWHEEATLLDGLQTSFFDNDISVLLQQANRFSDAQRRAILVGDAAATASFFEGMGANTALTGAAIAGRHLERLIEGKTDAFEIEMQGAATALLEDSRYLFSF